MCEDRAKRAFVELLAYSQGLSGVGGLWKAEGLGQRRWQVCVSVAGGVWHSPSQFYCTYMRLGEIPR